MSYEAYFICFRLELAGQAPNPGDGGVFKIFGLSETRECGWGRCASANAQQTIAANPFSPH